MSHEVEQDGEGYGQTRKTRPHRAIRTFGESTPAHKDFADHMRKIGGAHFFDSKAKSTRRHREKVYTGKMQALKNKQK